MQTSLIKFKDELREALLAFLWRQWSALGVAGHGGTNDSRLIDPEALLLFSVTVARHDARLFDEILDWLQCNADLINLQRLSLSRLQKERPLDDATILAAIAAQLLREQPHSKWRALIQRLPKPAPQTEPRLLFYNLPPPASPDKIWLEWGWVRPPVDLRGLSQHPRPDQPAAFLFKLRSLFGLQARAEVIAWLLSHETGHPAEIARDISYGRGSIQAVLNELTASGHVFSMRTGREKRFYLRHYEWRFLLTWPGAATFPKWTAWAPVFAALRGVFDLVNHPRLDAMSPDLQAVELRRALASVRLTKDGRTAALVTAAAQPGSNYLDSALDELRALLS